MTRSRALTVLVAAAVGLLPPAVPAHADAPGDRTVSRGVPIPAFYDPPADLPAANGALVRSERLPLALPVAGTARRLMYKSTDSNGRPVAVTGAYIEPSARWKGDGPRPLVALAPGTMGQGDQCSASMGLEHPFTLNGRTVSVGYEDVAVHRLLAAGAAVVVTDYAGLGTTDRLHTYVNRIDGAHALLDAARVARSLPGTSLTGRSRTGLFGYSQGGGASAAAAELASAYAPGITLAGAYSGAPPADLQAVIKGIDGSALAGALGWSVNGFLQSDPSLKPLADRHLSNAGRTALRDLSTMCIGDGIFRYAFQKSSGWTRDGASLSRIVAAEPKLRATLDAQRIGRSKPAAPVRVATGVQDDIVPHAQARRLAVDWCAKDANVTYHPVKLPNLGDGLITNHLGPLVTDQGAAVSWLTDRLSGKPAGDNCATLPAQP